MGPPPAPYPAHSLRRLPQCPPVHLSHPVPLSLTLSLSPGPRQPRPPAPPPHRAPPPHIHMAPRGASFRSVSHLSSCRMVMVSLQENISFNVSVTLERLSSASAHLTGETTTFAPRSGRCFDVDCFHGARAAYKSFSLVGCSVQCKKITRGKQELEASRHDVTSATQNAT